MQRLSDAAADLQGRLRELWSSVRLPPRGNDALLAVVAALRVPSVLAIGFRLGFTLDGTPAGGQSQLPVVLLILFSLAYGGGMVLLMIFARQLFFSMPSKVFQIGTDILIYSLAYHFRGEAQSDIHYLNIMPLLLCVEYLPFFLSVAVIVLISFANFVNLRLDPQAGESLQWLVRDLLPRIFIISTVGLAYLVHRRLRPLSDSTLESERRELVKQVRSLGTASPQQLPDQISAFEEELAGYLDKIDWYRRMLTREANVRMERFSKDLFSVQSILQPANLGTQSNVSQAIHEVIDVLAEATGCHGALLHTESAASTQATLVLEYAMGRAKSADEMGLEPIPIDGTHIVAISHRTRRVMRWVKGNPALGRNKPPFPEVCDFKSSIHIPVVAGQIKKGVATFLRATEREFSSVEQALMLSVLDYAAASISRALDIQTVESQSQELQRRLQLASGFAERLPSLSSEAAILDFSVAEIKSVFGAECVSVFLMRGEKLSRKADAGIDRDWFPEEMYRPGQSITGRAYVEESPYLLDNDVQHNAYVSLKNRQSYAEILPSRTVQHVLAVKIAGNKKTIGVMRLVNRIGMSGNVLASGFSLADAEIIVTLCSMIGLTVEAATRLQRQEILVELAKRTSTLVGRNVGSRLDSVEAICTEISKAGCKALNASRASIILFETEMEGVIRAQVEKTKLSSGEDRYQPRNISRLQPWIDLASIAAIDEIRKDHRPLAVFEARTDYRTRGMHHLFAHLGVESVLLLPLLANGQLLGVLEIDSLERRREFLADEIEVGQLIAALGAPAIAAAQHLVDLGRTSREEERFRIRDDLHNLLGILNSTAVVDLQLMEDMVFQEDIASISCYIKRIRNELVFLKTQAEQLMDDLLDSVLYDEGLIKAIEHYIENGQNLSERVTFQHNEFDPTRLEFQVQNCVYRITQEAITNACKHGIAGVADGEVNVRLTLHDLVLELEIEDNGKGFDTGALPERSLGHKIMRQWADDTGKPTDFSITSEPGHGTLVSLKVHLDHEEAENLAWQTAIS